MSLARPSVGEERWLAVAARYPQARDAVRGSGEAGNWRCATLLTRCLFFALGLFSAGLTYSIFNLLDVPVPGIVAGVALLATAEWLIARRLHASGFEEALWAAGAVMACFEFGEEIADLSDSAGLALCAITLALAGWRLLNPLFTTLAALVASCAITTMSGMGGYAERATLAGYLCFALGFFALATGARAFQRPCFDRMFDWLVVALPVFGYGWSLWERSSSFTFGAMRDGDLKLIFPAALLFVYGLVALTTGIRRRTHAPLIAALGCVVLLAVELRAVTGLRLEWRLMLWGSAGLLVAIALERWLRTPRDGITSRDIGEDSAAFELLQQGGAAMLAASAASNAPASTNTSAATPRGEGGEFGGGGASGRF